MGMNGIDEFDVFLDIQIQGHDNDLGLWTEEVGCIQNRFDLGGNVGLVEVIIGFECPHDFGHHEQAGDELDLAFDRLPKKRFDSFRFAWIVVRQKP